MPLPFGDIMKLVVREHINAITEAVKKEFSVHIDVFDNYGKIPASIGLMKGDIIAYRGNGDPVRLPVGSNGKVLTSDPTQPTGLRWGDAGGGSGAKVTLKNASGAQVTTGTIVYVFDTDNYGREAIKAPYWQEGRYYIVAEDTASGADMDCYCIPGSIVQVLVTGSCSIGDPLVVSATSGIATAIPGGTPTVGIAQEDKASSAVGLVACLLVENKAVGAQNADSASHVSGTVYALSSGHSTDGLGYILPYAVPVVKGKRPYGVQANAQSNADAPMLLHAKPGEIATVLADSNEVKVGDWLVPSTTAGYVRNGSGYGIGHAMSAKASGANGEVKVRLYPLTYGYSARSWWLPTGITEDEVIVAYQFINRESELLALKNINEGTEYLLTKSGDTVTWTASNGFLIPATSGAGLDNSAVRAMTKGTVAVRYHNATEGNVHVGLVNGNGYSLMAKMGFRETYISSGSRVYATRYRTKPGIAYGGLDDTKYIWYGSNIADETTEDFVATNFSVEKKLTVNNQIATLANQSTTRTPDPSISQPRLIGHWSQGSLSYGSVEIDSVVIYNTILSDDQIAELYAEMP